MTATMRGEISSHLYGGEGKKKKLEQLEKWAGIRRDYRVSSDRLGFSQRRFYMSFTKSVSVVLCDET